VNDILVIDDHPLIGEACRLLLGAAGFENIIVDLSLQGERLAGIELIGRIHSKDETVKILVFSIPADLGIFVLTIEAGATGYLIKDAPTDELANAVHQVRSGHRYIAPQIALKLAFLSNSLVAQEKRVLALLMDGTSYASMADQLGISKKSTIKLTIRVRRRLSPHTADELIE